MSLTARPDRKTESVLQQGIYTFVFKVSPAHRDRLDRLLAGWGPEGAGTDALGLAEIEVLHFASVTIFDRPFLDSLMVLECNFDGSLQEFLPYFADKAGGLAELLNCRLGPAVESRHEVIETLRAAAVKPAAAHIGALGLSREEILASEALVAKVRRHLGTLQNQLHHAHAADLAKALQQAFGQQCPPLKPRRTAGEWLQVAAPAVIVTAALLTLVALGAGLWLLAFAALAAFAFRWAERREPVRQRPVARDDLAATGEDRPGWAQNHFSSMTPLKTGPVRWATLRVFMWILNQAARLIFTKGKLGRIPSIHFAHWAVVDQGSSLLFVSNYGGTWESYLDDFIQKAASGLTGVWGHTQGFPASRWLVGGGARDERAFKRYARDSQAREAIWFSAYPQLTTGRINNNRAIVEALAGISREPPERWLARI